MKVYAVTYYFAEELRTILHESTALDCAAVKDELHPAIRNKFPTVEYVGELA